MSDTVMRWLDMLQLVPREPKKIDTFKLQQKLSERGHEISLRSLQRDLQDASRRFPLLSDESQRPFSWYFPKDYVLDLPGMTPPIALAFSLLGQHAGHLLPITTREQLTPWFTQAEAVLDAQSGGVSGWREKVRVIGDWMPQLPPEIDSTTLDVIHRSLLQGKQFEGMYQGRRDQEPRSIVVNPLALVSRRQMFYLVATLWTYENPVQLAVHRFSSAETIDTPSFVPEGFDIDSYIDEGAFGVTVGEPVEVKLRFERKAGLHVLEMPISKDQRVEDDGEDHFILTATVPNNLMLRWWIASFGSRVELLEPDLEPL